MSQMIFVQSYLLKKFRPRKFIYRVDLLKDGQPRIFRCSASNSLEAQNRAIAHFGESYLILTNAYRE